jgi:hypothetical protein
MTDQTPAEYKLNSSKAHRLLASARLRPLFDERATAGRKNHGSGKPHNLIAGPTVKYEARSDEQIL